MKKKILVVDDDPSVIDFLEDALSLADFSVLSTQSPQEALLLAKENNPDVIIADLLMPQMRGEELVAQLAKDEKTAEIPVIFLTGLLDKEKEKAIKEKTGRYCLLAKPVTYEELIEAINRYI